MDESRRERRRVQKQAERERRAQEGLVRVEFWVDREHLAAVRAFIESLKD